MPKPSPPRQNRMPISSSLCPSIEPLKKLTEDRSGSFSDASPPADSGWAKAETAPTVSSAATAEIFVAMRREITAAVASQLVIRSSELNGFRNSNVFRFVIQTQSPALQQRLASRIRFLASIHPGQYSCCCSKALWRYRWHHKRAVRPFPQQSSHIPTRSRSRFH